MDLDSLGFFLYMEKQESKEKPSDQKNGDNNSTENEQQTDQKSRG